MKAEFKKGLLRGEIVAFNHYRLSQSKTQEQGQCFIFHQNKNYLLLTYFITITHIGVLLVACNTSKGLPLLSIIYSTLHCFITNAYRL